MSKLNKLDLRKIVNQVSFFGGANLINIALPVVLIPILAKFLIPEDYRVLSMFQMMIAFFAIFIGLQTQSSVLRYIKNDESDLTTDRSIMGSTRHIFSISFFVCVVVFVCTQNALSDFLKISSSVLLLSFMASNLYFFWYVYLNYCQAKENGFEYFSSTGLHALASLAFTLIFIGVGLGFNERILAITISAAVIGAASIYKLDFWKASWDHEILKKNLSYAIGIIPHSLFVFMLAYVDKLYVNTYSTEVLAGSYFLMFQVSQICLLIPGAFNKIFVPWIFNNGEDTLKMQPILKLRAMVFPISLVIFGCSITASFGYFILLVLVGDSSYVIAGSIFVILCAVATIDALYLFAVNLLHFLEKTKVISMITLAVVVFTLVLLSILVPNYGVLGAGLSALFGSLMRLVLTFTIGLKGFQRYHLNKKDVKL